VRTATGIECRIFDEASARVSTSAAVAVVVALPHGLSRSLVFGGLVAFIVYCLASKLGMMLDEGRGRKGA